MTGSFWVAVAVYGEFVAL